MATVNIRHNKVSGKPAGADPTRVYGTHWDEAHTITGIENVDNTSDADKNAATVTLTNKTIDTAGGNTIKINGNALAATAGTATVTVPNSTDTLVARATTDTLTNKTLLSPVVGDGTNADITLSGGSGAGVGGVLSIVGQGATNKIGSYSKVFSSGTAGDLTLLSGASNPMLFYTNALERIRIDGTTGNVGIGNPGVAPTNKLDITGTFRVTGAATLSSTLAVSGATTIGDGSSGNLSLSGGSGAGLGSATSFVGQGVTSIIGTTAKVFSAGTSADLAYFGGSGADQVFYTASTERLRIRNAGTYKATIPAPSNWSSLTTLSDGAQFNMNAYPDADRFGGGSTGTVEVLVGAVKVPSTAIGPAANAVAGYAQSQSTTTGAVGLYGQGGALADGVSTFGMNCVFTNSPGQASGANTGFDSVTGYGLEIDMNFNKLSGGTTPTAALMRGLLITGGAATGSRPAGGGFYATYITPANAFDGSVKWNYAHYVARGASDVGLYLGPTGFTGNSQASQPIQMAGINGAGTLLVAQIQADSGGNINYAPGASGSHLFLDGSFAALSSVDSTSVYARQTTQSTSTTTGALRSDGGLGVVKDVFIGGEINVVGSAWTSFSPGLNTIGGAYTTATTSGYYKKIGKTVFITWEVVITTVGPGNVPIIALPFTGSARRFAGGGSRDDDKGLNWKIPANGTTATVTLYDGTNPCASGRTLFCTFAYEAA